MNSIVIGNSITTTDGVISIGSGGNYNTLRIDLSAIKIGSASAGPGEIYMDSVTRALYIG
jgi:hypothetical protein